MAKTVRKAKGRKNAHGNTIMPDNPRYQLKRDRLGRVSHELTPGQKRTEAKQQGYVRRHIRVLPDRAQATISPNYDPQPITPEDFFDATPQQKAVRILVRALNRCEQEKIGQARRFQAELNDQALQFEEQLSAADERYNRFTDHANEVIQGLRAQLNPVEPKTAKAGFDEGARTDMSVSMVRTVTDGEAQGPIERGMTAIAGAEQALSDLEKMYDRMPPRLPWHKRLGAWLDRTF